MSNLEKNIFRISFGDQIRKGKVLKIVKKILKHEKKVNFLRFIAYNNASSPISICNNETGKIEKSAHRYTPINGYHKKWPHILILKRNFTWPAESFYWFYIQNEPN